MFGRGGGTPGNMLDFVCPGACWCCPLTVGSRGVDIRVPALSLRPVRFDDLPGP